MADKTDDKESHGNRRKRNKGSLVVGLGVIFGLVVFMLYIDEVDFMFDRTIEENMGIYFSGVEGTGNHTMGREKIGDELYDENNVYGTHFYSMGQEEYYVYVYTMDESQDGHLNEYAREYLEGDYERKLYRMDISQLDELETSLNYGAGVFLLKRMDRDNTIIVNHFEDGDMWKETWEWEIQK